MKVKNNDTGTVILLIFIIVFWLGGIVLAKSAWSTFFTIVFMPYAWYLMIEKIMILIGLM